MKKFIPILVLLLVVILAAMPVSAASYNAAEPAHVKIDGVVSADEWSGAIYKGVTFAQAEKGVDDTLSCWWFDGDHDGDSSFDLYITNDNKNLYIACVVHNTDMEKNNTGADLWKHQNFTFSLSDWNKGTNVRIIDYQGQKYEAYSGYRLSLLSDGTMVCEPRIQGRATRELFPNQDFVIRYDKAKRTMTYELAMPINSAYTYLDITKDTQMAFSAIVSMPYENNTCSAVLDGSNRFLIGMGTATSGNAENYAHKGTGSIKVNLNAPGKISQVLGADEEEKIVSTANRVALGAEPEDTQRFDTVQGDLPWAVIIALGAVCVLCVIVCVLRLILSRKGGKRS